MPDRLPYKVGQPLVKVQFLGFTPDLDASTRGLLSATNALVANENGYFQNTSIYNSLNSAGPSSNFVGGAFYSPSIYAPAVGSNAPGFIVAGYGDGHIYLLENTTFTAWDGGSTFGTNFQPLGGFFRFCQFGNDVLVTNYGGTPAVWASQSATHKFVTLGGSPPAGAIIESVSNNFVFIANSTVTGDDWQCAAQGTDNNWTSSITTLAANGRLLDTQGNITALRSLWQLLSFAVYKLSATYLGQFVGPPVIWQFTPISTSIGTFSQESVVDIGGVHVFPSLYDFYAFDGDSLQKIETPLHDWFYNHLNIPAVSQSLSGTINLPQSNILGTFDQVNNVVYWLFPTSSTQIDTWIAWNIKSNKWTQGVVPDANVGPPDYHATGIVAPYVGPYSQYGVPGTLQNNITQTGIFIGGQLKGFGGIPPFTPGAVAGYTADTTTYLQTGDIGDGLHYFLVTRVRPKFVNYPSNVANITCQGYIRENLGDTAQAAAAGPVGLDPHGWFNLRQSGKWHAFRIILGSACVITELEVEMVPQGIR